MKNVQQQTKRRAGIFGVICLLALALSSCVKQNYYNNNDGIAVVPSGALSVIAASPDAASLDFYLDNNRVNNAPITYGNILDYFGVYTGKRTAKFYATGSTNLIKSDTMTFNANRYYSLYLANVVAHPDYVLTRDTLVRPASGMATVRLVNVSSDAPALDLGVKGSTAIVTKKAYKTYSSFVPLAAGTYTLEVRQNGSNTVVATIAGVTLRQGFVYTVWAHGLVAGSGSTVFTADIQNNAYFY